MPNKKNTYSTITSREWDRIFGGVMSNSDFDTSKPNPCNITKIAIGIAQYQSYKTNHTNLRSEQKC